MAKPSLSTSALPNLILEELVTLGKDIGIARRRRRISRQEMAARMMVDPKTVDRMENGDPKLSTGILATALWILGMQKRLGSLISPESDKTGTQEEIRRLPQVIRTINAQADDFDF